MYAIRSYYEKLIHIINELSKQIQIVYLEGNHDYNMKPLFPNVLVVKRENQPLDAEYKGQSVQLSHGDNFTPWHYNLYCVITSYSIHYTKLYDLEQLII